MNAFFFFFFFFPRSPRRFPFRTAGLSVVRLPRLVFEEAKAGKFLFTTAFGGSRVGRGEFDDDDAARGAPVRFFVAVALAPTGPPLVLHQEPQAAVGRRREEDLGARVEADLDDRALR